MGAPLKAWVVADCFVGWTDVRGLDTVRISRRGEKPLKTPAITVDSSKSNAEMDGDGQSMEKSTEVALSVECAGPARSPQADFDKHDSYS